MSTNQATASPAADLNRWWRSYADSGDEAAFRHVVEHCFPLVHASARRILNGDATMADDVAQMVFIDLARSRRALPKKTILSAWLWRRARWTGSKLVRGESRRTARELKAHDLSEDSSDDDATRAKVEELLESLPDKDRTALLLRYFEGHGLEDVGKRLGVSRAAAQKRIERCLERLRKMTPATATVAFASLAAKPASASAVSTIADCAIVAGKTPSGSLALGFIKNAPALQQAAIGIALALIIGAPAVAWSSNDVKKREREHLNQIVEHQTPPSPPQAEPDEAPAEPATNAPLSIPEIVRRMADTIDTYGYSKASTARLNALAKLVAPEDIAEAALLLRSEFDPLHNPLITSYFGEWVDRWRPAGLLAELGALTPVQRKAAEIWVESVLKNNAALAKQISLDECDDPAWSALDGNTRRRIKRSLAEQVFGQAIAADPSQVVELIKKTPLNAVDEHPLQRFKLDPSMDMETRETLVDSIIELEDPKVRTSFIAQVLEQSPPADRRRIIDSLERPELCPQIATEITRRMVSQSEEAPVDERQQMVAWWMDHATHDPALIAGILPYWAERNVEEARTWYAENQADFPAEDRDLILASYAKSLPFRGHPQEAAEVTGSIQDEDMRLFHTAKVLRVWKQFHEGGEADAKAWLAASKFSSEEQSFLQQHIEAK